MKRKIFSRLFSPRRARIKASDTTLVFSFYLRLFLLSFFSILLLFHGKTLYHNPQLLKMIHAFAWTDYTRGSLLCALLFSLLVLGIVWYFGKEYHKQLLHRQKIAKMILENGWYESKQVEDFDLFCQGRTQKKEKICFFPKIYYRMKEGLLLIEVEISLGKYQEPLLHLEKKLESGLYCELVSKELKDAYVEYTLLYDTIGSRIPIEEVSAQQGKLKLMKSLYWEYDSLPHMLICGGTGGGKTYFILTLIEALLETTSILYILDPKNADLADLQTVMPNVYYRQGDMIKCLNTFYEGMMKRNEEMKQHPKYKTGENYAYLGLPAHFLIFDEYTSFMEMIGKESTLVMSKLKQIVMLGRQSGYFLILACQRPDAKYLGDGIRDNFNFRVGLGRMSELGYSMLFGESQKQFFLKQIKGRGYVDCGNSVISEFYTPIVPKDHDFLKAIQQRMQERKSKEDKDKAKLLSITPEIWQEEEKEK